MTVVGRNILTEAGTKHADAKSQLDAWLAEVEKADWKSPADLKRRYVSASFLRDQVVIFNVKGNRFRLVVKVNYPGEVVLVKWFGTHAEYDKLTF